MNVAFHIAHDRKIGLALDIFQLITMITIVEKV